MLVLSLIIFFSASLAISYEGFQVSPNPRIQDISIADTLSICKQMDFILESKSMSYENVIRLLNNNEINSHFNSKEIDSIEQCLQGQLPTLSSYLITQKTGFLQGLGSHEAKGKAEVIKIDKYSYLRLNSFEIGYDSKLDQNFTIPEFHIYLTQGDISTSKIYLDKLKTKLGSKNYRLPDVDLGTYDTVLIIDEIRKEPFAQITLEDPSYVKDILNNIADDIKTVEFPKIESRIIYERYGFFEGINNYNAKGLATVDYEEDEGELKIEHFEISLGKDLRLYLTKNGDIAKSGYWTLDSKGSVYISSGNTDEVLRYDADGRFLDVFVKAGSGGLEGPKDLTFGPDGNLYVSSGSTDEVLRYDADGRFLDVFVKAGSGGLEGPKDLTFGPDGNLYVSSEDGIFRFNGKSGKFVDVFVVTEKGGLSQPTGFTFGPDGNFYLSSGSTDEVLRYDADGRFLDVFVKAGSGGLEGPKDLAFSSNQEFLYVTSFLSHEILKYDIEGNFIDDIIGSHNGQILDPKYALFGPDGNLYVSSEDGIFRFNGKSGKFVDVFVVTEKGGLSQPTGFTFGPDGNFYLSSGSTDEVLRYDADGRFLDVFVKAGSGGLEGPKDLTFGPDGNLYVSSGSTDEVLRYDADGRFLDVFVNSNELKEPAGLTFGPDGNLYVVSSMTDEILLFDQNTGKFLNVFASGGGLSNPIDVSVGLDEFFYVSSGSTDEVLRYDADGRFLDVFVNSNELKEPAGLTFGPDGNLYVVSSMTDEILQNTIKNGELQKTNKFVTDDSLALYQPKHLNIYDGKICVNSYLTENIHCYEEDTGKSLGNLIVSFDRSLISRENSIAGPDGELYVSDDLNNEILRYDGVTGLFSDVVIRTGNDQLHAPSYLTFGPDGNLYVGSDDKIFRFDANDGTFIDEFIPKNKAGLRNPQQLSFDENYLYVTSFDNNRILRYDSQHGNFIDEFIPSRDHDLLGPVGGILDKETGNYYVGSTYSKKILEYDTQTGSFLSEIKLQGVPHGLALGNDGTLYIAMFDTNEVLSYDLNSKQSAVLLNDKDGLDGPEGIVFDAKNNIIYVSSSMNNKIIQYNLENNFASEVTIATGDGILRIPKGLAINDDTLFISNNNNNEILKYVPKNNILDIHVHDIDDLVRPGGITFGPDSYLYVINQKDNSVYQYNVQTGGLVSKFTESPHSTTEDPKPISLRNIIFTKDGRYLFASNPVNNEILAYDVKNEMYIKNFFKDNDALNYPTNLTLTPDGNYILIINYGENTISKFTRSGEFDSLFVNPGHDGLTELRDIRFGQDGNLYVMGGIYGEIFKYDGATGNFLGAYDSGGYYIGKMKEDPLAQKYLLNEIDTRQYNTAIIYDNFLERPYAKILLADKADIITPLNIGWNLFISNFNFLEEPKLKMQEITKHTGFFVGLNDITAYGQVITKSAGSTSLLTFENFSLDYDENQYVSTTEFKNVFIPEPNLIACIIPSTSEFTCGGSGNSIELGALYSNSGDNRYVLKNTDLNVYDTIVIYDKTTERSFATVPLRDYGIFRVSGESFLDWLQHDFAVIPLAAAILIIFPIFFDYTRSIFKILFFTIYFILGQHKSKKHLSSLSPIMHGKKISILIPAHNEELGIKESIKSALATDYRNKEIIVIDDGSKDKTWEIANSFAEKGLIKLVHRDPSKSSKASALNHGINYATGDYVLCMDGDTKLDKDSLKNAAKYFDDENTVAFSGNVKILAGDGGVDNTLTKLQTYEYMIAIELGRRFTSIFNILLVISGAFGIFKKDLIKNVHTFDKDTLTEDFDLTLKFRKTRGRIRFIPDSIAYTYCPSTWSMWVTQRNRWAYGQFQTLVKNKDLLRKFTIKDSISFIDMYLLDIILSILFPIGLVVVGIIAIILFLGDTLHVLVYPLTFVMSIFLILEFATFLFATVYSRNLRFLKLSYLVPVMTFFYRPYLKMINLRAYFRAYYKKGSKW